MVIGIAKIIKILYYLKSYLQNFYSFLKIRHPPAIFAGGCIMPIILLLFYFCYVSYPVRIFYEFLCL
jgi:hypothetical protein